MNDTSTYLAVTWYRNAGYCTLITVSIGSSREAQKLPYARKVVGHLGLEWTVYKLGPSLVWFLLHRVRARNISLLEAHVY